MIWRSNWRDNCSPVGVGVSYFSYLATNYGRWEDDPCCRWGDRWRSEN